MQAQNTEEYIWRESQWTLVEWVNKLGKHERKHERKHYLEL